MLSETLRHKQHFLLPYNLQLTSNFLSTKDLRSKMPPKRKRSNDADGQDGQDSTRNKQFAYLKPRVRQVPEKTIRSKWTTLPEPTQEQIRDMFKSLERPVIVRQRNERKRIEAQTAVQVVIRKYYTPLRLHFLFGGLCQLPPLYWRASFADVTVPFSSLVLRSGFLKCLSRWLREVRISVMRLRLMNTCVAVRQLALLYSKLNCIC